MADWLPERPMTKEEFGELTQLSTLLGNESLSFFGGLQPSTPQRDRRAFVRTFFSTVEALIWTIRRLTLSRHYGGKHNFSPSDLALLREEAYQLSNTGKPHRRPLRSSFEGSIVFVLTSFAAAYGIAFDDPSQDSKWPEFLRMIELRHRLTHPKKLADLDIPDAELNELRATHQWFWSVTMGLMNRIGAKHNNEWL